MRDVLRLRTFKNTMYLIWGTGVGVALFINGR